MDFIGLRSMMCASGLLFDELQNRTHVMFYDKRCRKSEAEELEIASRLRLNMDSYKRKYLYEFNGLLITDILDETRLLAEIGNTYFFMEPTLLPVSPSGECKQRIKSFQRWGKIETLRVKYGSVRSYKSIEGVDEDARKYFEEICQPKLWLWDKVQANLLRSFLTPPREVMFHPLKCLKVPLPLVRTDSHFIDVMTEWLSLMSWYSMVARELEPLVHRVRDTENELAPDLLDVIRQLKITLATCQRHKEFLFPPNIESAFPKISQDLGNLFTCQLDELLDFDLLGLDRSKFEGSAKQYMEDLLAASVGITRVTVSYIVDLHSGDSVAGGEDRCEDLKSEITSFISRFHRRVHKTLKKKKRRCGFRGSFDMKGVTDIVFLRTGNILKIYIGERLSSVPSALKHELTRYRHHVQHTQNLLKDLINEIAFSLNDEASRLYKLRIANDTLEMVLPQITIVASSSAVVNILKSSKFARLPTVKNEIISRTQQIEQKRGLLVISQESFEWMETTVHDVIEKCLNLVMQREEEGAAMIIPASFVYEDFPRYRRKFSSLFGHCPHELFDIDEFSGGRLYRFMTRALLDFEDHRRSFDQVLLVASQCLTQVNAPNTEDNVVNI